MLSLTLQGIDRQKPGKHFIKMIFIVVMISFVFAFGCSPRKSEDAKASSKTKAEQNGFLAINDLKLYGSHGETIKVFKDFHDQLHLINSFTQKEEYEPIGLIIPYLRQRLETFTKEEEKLATKENGYKSYLDTLYFKTQDFIATYDAGDYKNLRGAFRRMHDAYDDVKRHRPGGGLLVGW